MRLTRYLMACSTVVAVTQPVHAEPDATWSYEVTPYLHAAGLNGTVGAGRVRAHTDISFSDVLSHLDLALQGELIARKGPISLTFDAEYIHLSDDGTRSVTGPEGRATVQGTLDATSKLSIFQALFGYRILDEQTKVDLVGGLRVTGLDADLDLDGSLSVGDAVFGKSRSLSGSRDWVDVVGGARIAHAISDQVTLSGYVDVGGGSSNLTWQALVGVNWQVARDYTVRLGYRELSWDYSSGGVVWDMKLHGPYVGLQFRF
jgi:opacity protein-like surface antigen